MKKTLCLGVSRAFALVAIAFFVCFSAQAAPGPNGVLNSLFTSLRGMNQKKLPKAINGIQQAKAKLPGSHFEKKPMVRYYLNQATKGLRGVEFQAQKPKAFIGGNNVGLAIMVLMDSKPPTYNRKDKLAQLLRTSIQSLRLVKILSTSQLDFSSTSTMALIKAGAALKKVINAAPNAGKIVQAKDTVKLAWQLSVNGNKPHFRISADVGYYADDAMRTIQNSQLFKRVTSGPVVQPAKWYPAVGQECNSFCSSQGKVSAVSPDGASCVSGEVRPGSAIGKVNFVYGCWPNCAPHGSISTSSQGRYCYHPGQKRDRDRTDITVGCYCR